MNIIGICGVAGAGKSTSAGFLVAERGLVEISLADEMKRICRTVYGFTEEQLWGPSEMRNAPDERFVREVEIRGGEQCVEYLTPRYALQKLGTEWGRHCYVDTWVDIVIRTAEKLLSHARIEGTRVPQYTYTAPGGLVGIRPHAGMAPIEGVVVADVRYPNEALAIQKAGGKVFKLSRRAAGLGGTAGSHTSETSIGRVQEDVLICNDGTLGELRERVLVVYDAQRMAP